jgi:hypothetical protein
MRLKTGVILRAGITWGIVAILIAILATALSSVLPHVDGLTIAAFAFLLAGVHYAAKAHGDFLLALIGGGLAGVIAALFLLLVRLIPFLNLPTPPGTPLDLIGALLAGLVAGAFGGLAFNAIVR